MVERFGIRAVRTVGVAGVSLLLIVGGAFAADQLANSGPGDDNGAPTASFEPEASEMPEASESPEASDDHGDDDASASPGATFDDHGGDDSSPEPSDDHGGQD